MGQGTANRYILFNMAVSDYESLSEKHTKILTKVFTQYDDFDEPAPSAWPSSMLRIGFVGYMVSSFID